MLAWILWRDFVKSSLSFFVVSTMVLWVEEYCHFTLVLPEEQIVASLFLHPILLTYFGVVGFEPKMCNGTMCFVKVFGFIGKVFNGGIWHIDTLWKWLSGLGLFIQPCFVNDVRVNLVCCISIFISHFYL